MKNGPAFNHHFTRDTSDAAKREVELRYQQSKRDRESQGYDEEVGFTRAVADAAKEAIDGMPETTTNFNVEISGPTPLRIIVEHGPR